MTEDPPVHRNAPRWQGNLAPAVAWSCAVAAIAILAAGLMLQSPWWMLSTPVAVAGAIAGGNSRRLLPMIICLAVIAVLVLALAIFAP